jgi:hypothetical protein
MYVVVPYLHPFFHVVIDGHVVAAFRSREEADAAAARANAAQVALNKARRDVFSDDEAVADAAEQAMKEAAAILKPLWAARRNSIAVEADKRFLFLTD